MRVHASASIIVDRRRRVAKAAHGAHRQSGGGPFQAACEICGRAAHMRLEVEMARLPRFDAVAVPHHVIQRGNNRSACFAVSSDYERYLEYLATACRRHDCHVHAYVLMTNHAHLLITPNCVGGIGKVMQSVGRRYVRRFNDTYARTGTLWEGRYRAALVDSETYLFACHRYIEMNPVRAGLASWPNDYPWSSHAANAYGASDPIVTPHARYLALDTDDAARRAAYRALFGIALTDAELDTIRQATNAGWALGSTRFRREVEAMVKRRARPLKGMRRVRSGDPIGV